MTEIPPPPTPPMTPVAAYAEPQERKMSVVGLIGLILAGLALLLALLGPLAFLSWFAGLPAFILGLVGLFKKSDKKGLPVAAVIVSVVAFILSIVVFFVSVNAVVSEVDSGLDALDDRDVPTLDAGDATEEPSDGDEPRDADASARGSLDSPLANGVVWEQNTTWFGEESVIWEGTIDGVAALAPDEVFGDPGRCYAVVGVLTPTFLPEGQDTASWIDTPSFTAYVNGTGQSEFGFCDTTPLESAGYNQLMDLEVTLGTAYPYFHIVFLPEDVEGDIDVIAATTFGEDNTVYSAADPITIP